MNKLINKNSQVISVNLMVSDANIYTVMVHTRDRWINYHEFNDTMFGFGEEPLYDVLYLDKFLPNEIDFMPTTIQDKDNILFVYIPVDLMVSESKNIKLEQPDYP